MKLWPTEISIPLEEEPYPVPDRAFIRERIFLDYLYLREYHPEALESAIDRLSPEDRGILWEELESFGDD